MTNISRTNGETTARQIPVSVKRTACEIVEECSKDPAFVFRRHYCLYIVGRAITCRDPTPAINEIKTTCAQVWDRSHKSNLVEKARRLGEFELHATWHILASDSPLSRCVGYFQELFGGTFCVPPVWYGRFTVLAHLHGAARAI